MRHFLCAILLLLSFAASAEELSGTPNQVFRPLSKKIVDALINGGIRRVGDLDLRRLIRQLDTVEWRTQDMVFMIGSGRRITSVYNVEERMVIINMLSLQNLVNQPVPMFGWALHEGLGALGYLDENYELTTSLQFLADNLAVGQNHVPLIAPALNVGRTDRNRTYQSGGSTVVGGGGDAPMIELKRQLVGKLHAWAAVHRPGASAQAVESAFLLLLRMPIEFKEEQNQNNTSFEFRDGMVLMGYGFTWRLGELYQLELLDEILATVAPTLFP